MKIAIIVPYFGKFRNDFYFWLKSVEYNPTIDFLIFTDQSIKGYPQNVKVHLTTLKKIENLAKTHLFPEVIISSPYKLCDFKPAYGEIFKDYLIEYDFWGHCDCDLIFGDIRHFITDEILNLYDRILTRGHLTLYRNSATVNLFFKKCISLDYKEVFSCPKSYCFDEWEGTSQTWNTLRKDKLYDKIIFDDIKPFVYSFYSIQKQDTDLGRSNFMFLFDRGKLWRYYEENHQILCEETCYVHFAKRQLQIKTPVSFQFTIIPNAIVPFVNEITLSYLHSNIRTCIFWVYMERFKQKLTKYFRAKPKRTYLTLYK